MSRARHGAGLVTDDRYRLCERLEGATGERIAALEWVEGEPEKRPDYGWEGERGQEYLEGPGGEVVRVPELNVPTERAAPGVEL